MDLGLTSNSHCKVSGSCYERTMVDMISIRSDRDWLLGKLDGVEGYIGGITVPCRVNGRVSAINPGVELVESLVGDTSSALGFSIDNGCSL